MPRQTPQAFRKKDGERTAASSRLRPVLERDYRISISGDEWKWYAWDFNSRIVVSSAQFSAKEEEFWFSAGISLHTNDFYLPGFTTLENVGQNRPKLKNDSPPRKWTLHQLKYSNRERMQLLLE
jgi:hypothetical protein